ncbi:unnamed protein product [Lepeophtheirus salmonis]|uniref:(salmon louse) hypothetical protein n=1 Tax=Lepeophtheirus salmonis TaxID=72036 RepID=A0A7R8H4L4_LEPSM|nr:unnamed protein product [Lepeophtheirus salmonis]CAF2848762.1 unnamed protein product [Lepeophtheirus salmonis]
MRTDKVNIFLADHRETSVNLCPDSRILVSKPYSDGDFVKRCMMKASELVCPDKRQDFGNVSLTRNTIAERILELSEDLTSQSKQDMMNWLMPKELEVLAEELIELYSNSGISIEFEVKDDFPSQKLQEFIELHIW